MRKYLFIALSLLFFASSVFTMGSASKEAKSAHADVATVANGDQVIAYYFHGNFRCPTCHKMEEYAKEAIDTNFAPELSSGKLVFKAINVDRKENEHFIDEYQLYTKSLIVSLVKAGKEIKSKNLTKIWEYVGNKNTYSDYVTNEIAVFLREL